MVNRTRGKEPLPRAVKKVRFRNCNKDYDCIDKSYPKCDFVNNICIEEAIFN